MCPTVYQNGCVFKKIILSITSINQKMGAHAGAPLGGLN